ncbi:MAG: glycosyltransferase family 2 protein [Alphaproteobacteria bacterium]|nr:glycosyltransferase family 2 protein [Alphaproteobacteria bacterium]
MATSSTSRRKAPAKKTAPKTPDISIVVPVMNEEGNITPLIEDIQAAFHGRNIEIIYVNDASSDGTAEELAGLQKTVKSLRVLTHSKRCGQSAALRSGIFAARAPLIGTLDGDGQNLPSDLVNLEKEVLAHRPGLVMAAGVRVNRQDGAAKRYASIFARKIRRWMLKDDHPDTGCATKVFDRELFFKLPYFDHIHRFMPPLARREGATVLAVPVGHAARVTGQSKYKTLDRLLVGISDILGVMWLIRRSPKNLKVKE